MQNGNNDAPECRSTGDQERGQSYTAAGEGCPCGCGRGRTIPADDAETRAKIRRYLQQMKTNKKGL